MKVEIPNISQTNAMGNNNSQVGVQYNHEEHHHHGLTVADATSMAFAMFREYYPQLRQEALNNLEQFVQERLSQIPPENIVPPTPRIAVPTLQNASITEETNVRKLYANLLVSSMDSSAKNRVHPGYVEIINQLSPEEARILKQLMKEKMSPTITVLIKLKSGGEVRTLTDFSDIPQRVGCINPLESQAYFDNLERLGLVKRFEQRHLTDETKYTALKNNPYVDKLRAELVKRMQNDADFAGIDYQKGYVELTSFGSHFCKVCVADDLNP